MPERVIRFARFIAASGPASAAAGLMLVAMTVLALIALLGDPDAASATTRIALHQPDEHAEGHGETAHDEAHAAADPHHGEASPDAQGEDGHDAVGELIEATVDAAHTATANFVAPDMLAPAPADGLTEPGEFGPLPTVSMDGHTSRETYARPAAPGDIRPQIALIISGLGRSRDVSEDAVRRLPRNVTLAFSPYAPGLQNWIDAARATGHEVILELPMEPFDYPANDPGPHTLLANGSPEENARRLDYLMSRATGYFAVMNRMGARFTAVDSATQAVLHRVASRGVGFIYDGAAPRPQLANAADAVDLSLAAADRLIDARLERDHLDEQLLHLEALAIQNGDALGVGQAYPLTVELVNTWASALERRGFALVPASAILERRAAHTHERLVAEAEAASSRHDRAVTYATVRASFGRHDEEEEDSDGGDHGGGH